MILLPPCHVFLGSRYRKTQYRQLVVKLILFQHGQTKIIEINGPFWSMANHPIEVYVNACDIFGKEMGGVAVSLSAESVIA